MDRLARVRQHIDPAGSRGLEIGPLVSPVVTPDLGPITYADHASTADLRAKYASDPAVDVDHITPVDIVWGERSLAEAAGAAAPFGYVVASHVIEHVPDIVGWLKEVAAVLVEGGRLCLVIPDRRLTFDVRRRPSDIAEVVEAYLLNLRRPALRATFDHFSRYVPVDTLALWHGLDAFPAQTPVDLAQGWRFANRAAESDGYLDTHCWVFSDMEFVHLVRDLIHLGLFDYRFVGFDPPQLGDLEFFAVLERLPANLSAGEMTAVALASLPADDRMAQIPLPAPPQPPDPSVVTTETLSAREIALVLHKRRAMAALRIALSRMRRHG